MRLPSAITAMLALSVISAETITAQPTTMRCAAPAPAVTSATHTVVTVDVHFLSDSGAFSCTDAAPSSPLTTTLQIASRISVAAIVAQTSGVPEAWPRTPGGLVQRLADQSGAVAIQALTYHTITQRLDWQSPPGACPTGVLARPRCALARTLVVHNRKGAPRPDVARIAGLTFGSAGSLLWRPERHGRGEAVLFVATRVGSGLAFAALRQTIARGRPTRRR